MLGRIGERGRLVEALNHLIGPHHIGKRHDLRGTLATLLDYLQPAKAA